MGTSNVSPRKYIEKHFHKKVENIKSTRKSKISEDDFQILTFREHEKMLEINYNVSQLKRMARFYKQKVSGNKKELLNRIYNFLRLSSFSIVVQKVYRGHLRRKYNRLHGGPSGYERCTNNTDFLSLNGLADLPHYQFFSFKDKDGFAYGFDIKSLHNLLKKQTKPTNPYNRKPLSRSTVNDAKTFVRLAKMYKYPVDLILEDPVATLTHSKRLELRALSIFQKIDSLGHITNPRWLLDLDKPRMIRFMKELADIWNYRAQLTTQTKAYVCPPQGNPFQGISIQSMVSQNEHIVRTNCLFVIENMVVRGRDKSARSLGAFYVLGALTLISSPAASALPWLYESVVHI